MSTHDGIAELAAVYALGALDGPELERFEALLRASDEDALRLLREFEETLVALAREEQVTSVPDAVRAALLTRIAASGPAAPGLPAAPSSTSGRAARRPGGRGRETTGRETGGSGTAGPVTTGPEVSGREPRDAGRLDPSTARPTIERPPGPGTAARPGGTLVDIATARPGAPARPPRPGWAAWLPRAVP